MGVADYGTGTEPLSAPGLDDWAAAVAAALNLSDVTVDSRVTAHNNDTTSVHGIPDTSTLLSDVNGKVSSTSFDANTILKADADNSPTALTVAEQTLVGRVAAGSIAALPANTVRSVLGQVTTHPSTDDVKTRIWDDTTDAAQTVWYDTGVRSQTLTNAWTATTAVLRRVGHTVEMVLVGLDGSSATASDFYTLPTAFRPPYPLRFTIAETADAMPSHVVALTSNGVLTVGGTYADVTAGSLLLRFNTSAVTPTSLPGSLVTQAPVD